MKEPLRWGRDLIRPRTTTEPCNTTKKEKRITVFPVLAKKVFLQPKSQISYNKAMKKKMKQTMKICECLCASLLLVAMLFCACKPEPIEPVEPAAKDVDGNIYKTVKIGAQIWMSEDLKVLHLPDGSDLQPFKIRQQSPSFVITEKGNVLYNSMAAQFGSGSAVAHVRGICPKGWHLPTSDEWRQLVNYVSEHPECWDTSGSVSNALASQKWPCSWGYTLFNQKVFSAFNQTGFSALPTGYYISYACHTEFAYKPWVQRQNVYYWSADHNDYYPRPITDSPSPWNMPAMGWFGSDSLETHSFVFLLDINKEQPEISSLPDIHYCAIRCVKD